MGPHRVGGQLFKYENAPIGDWFCSANSLCILIRCVILLCVMIAGDVIAAEPEVALQAAEDRLLDRLWQMPFYLTTARPHRAEETAQSTYGPWREQIVATVFWVGE